MRAPPPPLSDIATRPTTFTVGAHKVVVAMVPPHGRWSVAVDGAPGEATFESAVDAWAEGVRVADVLDHGAPPAR